ncbi:MAG: carboxypeptidase regulatory-like domain-containing protein [Phycisphaerae bacterium]|nr:carboxypeptidase regulatory-like domain-containing protein [Phycisphaerae bacterium]
MHLPAETRALAHGVHCTGKVMDPNGQPIEGVKVSLYRVLVQRTVTLIPQPSPEVVTAIDGAYSLPLRTVFSVHETKIILAQKEGCALGWAHWDTDMDHKADIELGPPSFLGGQVVDPCGAPVKRATVRIEVMEAIQTKGQPRVFGVVSESLFTRQTDQNGRFRFECVPAHAKAELAVEKCGWVRKGESEAGPRTPLVCPAGREDIRVVLIPVPRARIQGTVVDKANGRGVSGVKLSITQHVGTGAVSRSVTSVKDGSFRLADLLPGWYSLSIAESDEGQAEWVAEPSYFRVESGRTETEVDLVASRGGLLEVLVTDAETCEAVEGASIGITEHITGPATYKPVTDQGGMVRLRLLPRAYCVRSIQKHGYPYRELRQVIQIQEGLTTRQEYETGWDMVIRGVVRDKAGEPVRNTQVEALGIQVPESRTDGQGRFHLGSNQEGFQVGRPVCLVARHETLGLVAIAQVDPRPQEITLTLGPGMTLMGRVTHDEGQPMARANLSLMLRFPGGFTRLQELPPPDRDGRFTVAAMPRVDQCRVQLTAPGYQGFTGNVPWKESVDGPSDLGRIILAKKAR